MSSTNKQSGAKRKRSQREQPTDEEKLTRSAAVLIRREGKQVRTYSAQKLIKRIKSLLEKQQQAQPPAKNVDEDDKFSDGKVNPKSASNEKSGEALEKAIQKRQRQIKNLEARLSATKEFNLDALVKMSLKRLGLDVNDSRDASLLACTVSDEEKLMAESMLEHQKMVNAMRDLRGKISRHRTKMQNGEAYFGTNDASSERVNRNKIHEYSTESGIFIESLSGAVGTVDQQEDESNPADYSYGNDGTKKKNRKGQRARKAAALAREAEAAGETWDSSVNWRPKKARKKNAVPGGHKNVASGLKTQKDVKATDVADMGKNWKEEGKAHPSWAAKQHAKQQSGIGSFVGKKITFD